MEAVTRGQFTGDNKKAVKWENGSFVELVCTRVHVRMIRGVVSMVGQ